MLAFEVAYYEDPVVAGAGGETYRRLMPPLAPLGTILLPVGCLVLYFTSPGIDQRLLMYHPKEIYTHNL